MQELNSPSKARRAYYSPGACSLAMLVALEEAGLDYEPIRIDLRGERAAYRQINPAGTVPALVEDGELLTENPAILYRAAAAAPERGLFPAGAKAASELLSLLCWFSSQAHIARRRLRSPARFSADLAAQKAISEEARPVVLANLVRLDERLQSRPWLFGERFTVADAYGLVFYNWGRVDGFDLSAFAHFERWKAQMLVRPGVRRALAVEENPLLTL